MCINSLRSPYVSDNHFYVQCNMAGIIIIMLTSMFSDKCVYNMTLFSKPHIVSIIKLVFRAMNHVPLLHETTTSYV